MITIATNTFCRPDLVQLLADSLAVTLNEPYEFVVWVQPGGLKRLWRNVHKVIDGKMFGYRANIEVLLNTPPPFVYLHDDCIPVLPWTQEIFPKENCSRISEPTVAYYSKKYSPIVESIIPVTRVSTIENAPIKWGKLRNLASECLVESLANGIFLHTDKGTMGSQNTFISKLITPELITKKRLLVQEIASFLGFDAPDPLSSDEILSIPTEPPNGSITNINYIPPIKGSLFLDTKYSSTQSIAQEDSTKSLSQIASDEQLYRRFSICTTCEFLKNNECIKCGCQITKEKDIMNKLYRADSECPIGKWGKVGP